ncbi:ribonuclease E/G family protein [Pelagerythrobacter rhizovicinus]|uniref:Ribonuclease n=1 Tax=Pelagerythrobacter rhizovicinus TaxID=2268576 RepID=A0A4Q2KRS0_9SPHN|nr:ribonuclease E/G [Pelagerythrobacter rhizovicinus]RXZ66373.1 ribonuclease [Pelagerythrobacter rhizovicinus]
MADWLVEEGIGEHRAVRLSGDRIIHARVEWPGRLAAGHVADAVLVSRAAGAPRGTVRFASGEEALVDRLPRDASEGAAIRVEIVRAAIGERGRTKLAQARPSDKELASPTLAELLQAEGHAVRVVHRFPECGWDELVDEALDGTVTFAGGSLLFAPTPAMTVVDIDGALRPRELALAAVVPLADAIRRFDLGGSIGIDFPTLQAKADRRQVDDALGALLAGWPHERTAMNGFGFVQLVARLERPSLLHLARLSRTGFAARRLLRQAERVAEPGALLLTCHPAVQAALRREWREKLARRAGREVRIAADSALALEAGFAQAVTS